MNRFPSPMAPLVAAAVLTAGCGFQHSTSVTAPTAASNSSGAGTSTSTNTSTTPSLVGVWTSAALPELPSPTTCGNFQYQVATQTASTIAGTFTGLCGGGMAMTGTASGQLNGTAVAITVSGVASTSVIPSCTFSLSGTGTVEDSGYTLRIPFTGTTCLGPVSGTQVLRRPQPQVQIVLGEPNPLFPTANLSIDGLHPRFTVADSSRSGPAGAVSYLIELANDEAFTSKVATWSVPEQPNQTVLDPPLDVSFSKVYYWHVRASDPTTSGPWSRTLAFATKDPPPPVNTGGQDALDLHQVTVVGSARDVADWPITAKINVLDFAAQGVDIEFTKKNGAGRWPDVVPAGWDGGIQYTLWMVVNVDGHWYTAGGVEYWYGLGRSGGPPSQFANNWYYNPQIWAPLTNHQPGVGEQVGFFVTAGDARAKDFRIVTERSNVVVVPFPSDGGGTYPFSAGAARLSVR
jgi:hypothetical protein